MTNERVKGDSLKKRYLYKLGANVVGLLISLVTQAIIPRGLGPDRYGDFNFLSNFFNQLIGFFDMGTSMGFYTKLSQRPKDTGLVSFYLLFFLTVSIGVIVFVAVAAGLSLDARLWPSQKLRFIFLAAGLGMLTWALQITNQMADAFGLTVSTELGKIAQKVVGLILIVMLFELGRLDLTNFFAWQYATTALLIGLFIMIITRTGNLLAWGTGLTRAGVGGYLREFYQYSNPLFGYALAGLIAGVFDRWLLQRYAGSAQQGFFGLSYQISMICILFTSAMTPLLMREFSIAFADNDQSRMTQLFQRYFQLFYSIAAYFSCFIAMQADRVVAIVGGDAYTRAVPAVVIMAFYPIHQTYGQLGGSIYYATGRTVLYRNIGILLFTLGLPLTYVLIAPSEHGGFAAGSTGLALKMVLINIISVNALLFYNTRMLGLSYIRYVIHQIASVAVLVTLAFLSRIAIDRVLPSGSIIFVFILSGFSYTMLLGVTTIVAPQTIGLTRDDLRSLLNEGAAKLRALLGGRGNRP